MIKHKRSILWADLNKSNSTMIDLLMLSNYTYIIKSFNSKAKSRKYANYSNNINYNRRYSNQNLINMHPSHTHVIANSLNLIPDVSNVAYKYNKWISVITMFMSSLSSYILWADFAKQINNSILNGVVTTEGASMSWLIHFRFDDLLIVCMVAKARWRMSE